MIDLTLLRAAFLQAVIERDRRRIGELLVEAEARATTGDLRRDLLAKAVELEAQAEQAAADLAALAHDATAALNN